MSEPAVEISELGKTLIEVIDTLMASPHGAMVRLAKWPGEEEVLIDVLVYRDRNPDFESRARGGMVRLQSGDTEEGRNRKLSNLADAIRRTIGGNEPEESIGLQG